MASGGRCGGRGGEEAAEEQPRRQKGQEAARGGQPPLALPSKAVPSAPHPRRGLNPPGPPPRCFWPSSNADDDRHSQDRGSAFTCWTHHAETDEVLSRRALHPLNPLVANGMATHPRDSQTRPGDSQRGLWIRLSLVQGECEARRV